jgi:hypothetical protein
VIQWLLSIPFDKTVMYHRWLGRFVLVVTLVHMLWYFATWFDPGTNFWDSCLTLKNLWGLLATVCLVIVVVSSLGYFRRKHFEKFYWIHFTFLGWVLFGCLHTDKFIPYAIASTVLYALDRLIRAFWGLRVTYARQAVSKPGGVIALQFPRHMFARHALGNYVFLNFPTVSPFEWHPYTLSSGPNDVMAEVHIKSLGDHTGKLLEKVKAIEASGSGSGSGGKAPKLWMRVDGPYGHLSLNYKRYRTVVLVGGGVGVTPMVALIKDAFQLRMNEAAKKATPRSPLVKHIVFVWACASYDVFTWFKDVVEEAMAQSGQPGYPTLECMVHLSKASEEDIANKYSKDRQYLRTGRPLMVNVFKRVVELSPSKRVAVIACGPSALVNSAWDAAVHNSRTTHVRFDFHHEEFDF